MSQVKSSWRKAVKERHNQVEDENYARQARGEFHLIEDSHCTKKTFTPTLKLCLDKLGDRNLVGGFRRAGIFPFNVMEPHQHCKEYTGNLKNPHFAAIHDEIRDAINDEAPHDEVHTLVLPEPVKKDVPIFKATLTYVYADGNVQQQYLHDVIHQVKLPDSIREKVSFIFVLFFFFFFSKKFLHFVSLT